ncbi:FkbM family methyltransferase [Natronoarchaeum sp. GCM10025703]|uniref:FkbM family methyltransferase n=1 Tax=unclassified Natronoarchaeum TaxID=2620183 RepID=UPI00360BF5D3
MGHPRHRSNSLLFDVDITTDISSVQQSGLERDISRHRVRSVYREDGALVLCKKTLRKLHTKSYCRAISVRGYYSLNIDDRTVEFSAPTPTLVERNRQRFRQESEEIYDFFGSIKKEDDVVYDIGANTGLYSLFAATKCRHGKVIAFEPYPPNVEMLRQDLEGGVNLAIDSTRRRELVAMILRYLDQRG